VITVANRISPSARTGLTLAVLAVFCTVVGAGTLFACPFMQVASCCSKANPGSHCPSDGPENCLLDVSDNKVITAKPKLSLTLPVVAAISTLPAPAPHVEARPAPLPARDSGDLYLLNRILLI
jgi:hypothetical protein